MLSVCRSVNVFQIMDDSKYYYEIWYGHQATD